MLSLVYASLLRVKGISSSISSAVVSMPSRAYASLLPDTPCVLKCGKSSVNALSGLCLIFTQKGIRMKIVTRKAVSMPSRAYASLLP